MSNLFERLSYEILNEGDNRLNKPPRKFELAIMQLRDYDAYYLFTRMTNWVESKSEEECDTAGVRPLPGKRIEFVYWPPFCDKLTIGQIYFLLAHEITHILQKHNDSWNKYVQIDPKFAANPGYAHHWGNIAMDVWINNGIKGLGTFGGNKLEPITNGFFYREKWGEIQDIEEEMNKLIKKTEEARGHKIPPEEKFENIKTWDKLYEWVVMLHKKYDLYPKAPPPPPPYVPKVGDIMHDPKSDQYGKIEAVDTKTGKVTKITPMTKQEAEDAVTGKGFNGSSPITGKGLGSFTGVDGKTIIDFKTRGYADSDIAG
jgi:hypothetical protein